MPSTLAPWGRAYLDSGTTALALAMRVVRRDGQVLGWTNIRRPTTLPVWNGPYNVPSQRYDSKYRLQVSNLERSARPDATDNMEASLVAPDATFLQDAEHGQFFGAAFTLLFFDWRTDRPLMLAMRGTLGERKVTGQGVSFKMRSLAQALQNDVLDVTSPYSRAVWGDEELANFNLDGNTNDGFAARLSGAVTGDATFPRRRFTLASSIGFPPGRFVGGTATFLSGNNTGLIAPILDHNPATGLFTLDDGTRFPIAGGDSVKCQIRPPLTIDEWKTYFGTGFGFAAEPGIPNNTTASEISGGN
jgi:hypothetical protein